MKVLSIDVTAAKLVVVAYDGEKTSYKISQESGKKHNALVMPYIEIGKFPHPKPYPERTDLVLIPRERSTDFFQ